MTTTADDTIPDLATAPDPVSIKVYARSAVVEARRKRDEWEATADAAAQKAVWLEDLTSDDLADPTTAARVAGQVAAARDEERVARRGAALQDEVVLSAETAYVEACLQVARTEAAAADAAVQRHLAHSAKLFAALKRHEGITDDFEILWPWRRSDDLKAAAKRAAQTVELLELLADGQPLEPLMNHWSSFGAVVGTSPETHLPASLHGDGAVVNFRRYLARRRAA